MRRIYPLNALRAFEASARHLSFVKAAEELNVTAAAVSHQVKKLEEYLDLQLFRRRPRGLLLADAGQVLWSELSDVFQRLDKAMEQVLETQARGTLTISVPPVFAVKWLVPRLQRFDAEHPDIDVRMSSSLDLVDFGRDEFDAAIRLGDGQYPGLTAKILFAEAVTPMCSPRLLEQQALDTPDDLVNYVLLHNSSMAHNPHAPGWQTWLDAAGACGVNASRGPHFNQPDHAIQAAVDGTGIVLGWKQMVADDLAAGRLVMPFELELPLRSTFYLVYPEAYSARQKVIIFQDWLLREIALDEAASAAIGSTP